MQGTYDLRLQHNMAALNTADKQPASVSTRNLRLGSRFPTVAFQREPATSPGINSNPGTIEMGHLADASKVEQSQISTSKKDNEVPVTLGSSLNYSLHVQGVGEHVNGPLSANALQAEAMPGELGRPRLVPDVESTQAGVAHTSFHGTKPCHGTCFGNFFQIDSLQQTIQLMYVPLDLHS
jgi:hypothetical protein